jgi:hypothetical protein
MDSISLKLIDRKGLKTQIYTFKDILEIMRKENKELSFKFDLAVDKIYKLESLFKISENQKSLLERNFESQKIIIQNQKIRARKNKLYFFGGGLAVGVLAFAILVN